MQWVASLTDGILHHQLVLLPHRAECAPPSVPRRDGVGLDPTPTGILVEV